MQAFFFFVGLPQMVAMVPALLVETVETGDKNRDDFRCIQMSRDEHVVYFRRWLK